MTKDTNTQKRKLPPVRNYSSPVLTYNPYQDCTYTANLKTMTKAEWKKAGSAYKGIRYTSNGLSRVRTIMSDFTIKQVFLTDSKAHEIES